MTDVTDFNGTLAKPADETMIQVLSSGTGLEIVERSQIDKLFQEFKFKGSFDDHIDYSVFSKSAKNIDFVILGSVSSAVTEARFTEASTHQGTDGKYYRTPASCSVYGQAIVNVRAVSTSNGSIYKVFDPFKGNVYGSTEVRSSYECRVNNPTQLAISATIKAIENAKDDFMDAFPRYGYISKTMTNPKNSKDRIAVVSLGRNDGIKAGYKLILAKYTKTHDRIKGIDSLIIQDIGEMEVNETGLADNQCLVKIPEEFSDDALPGYIVKTKADRSFLKKIFK